MCTRDTFIRLYADKAIGILTEKRFWKLTDAMKKEQEINQNRMLEIAALISKEEHAEGNVFMGNRALCCHYGAWRYGIQPVDVG